MSTTSPAPAPAGALRDDQTPDAALLGRGLAALRIFFGVILFANGISKLFNFTDISLLGYKATLIDRGTARAILENESDRTSFPLVGRIANDVLLPHWGLFEWVITFMELGVGALLILGLATRGAALLGLGQHLFLAAMYYSSSRWAFEQPHEYVPLIVLAIVPSGRVWGMDRAIIRRRPELRRWPF